ncbi:MAG: cation transporter, partial [Thermoleophilia bacterium]|nr:cation transporter [Thermoleophilia bacterium]
MPEDPQHAYSDGSHSPSGHSHTGLGASPDRRLLLSLALNFLITLLQVVGGLLANSLALLSDAAHNLSDVVALGLSLWAVRLGRRPPTARRTFAYKRAEILVALFNSTVLVAISVYIAIEAIRRLVHPQPVGGLLVVVFAAGGLIINTSAALLLRTHKSDLNLRAAFLHLVADALTSLGVILSGLVVFFTGWNYADAVVSVLVSVWIGREAFAIVRRSVNVLMEGTPEEIKLSQVEDAILGIPGIHGVHDLHVWAISSRDLALS